MRNWILLVRRTMRVTPGTEMITFWSLEEIAGLAE
jgi:hypothetical protein